MDAGSTSVQHFCPHSKPQHTAVGDYSHSRNQHSVSVLPRSEVLECWQTAVMFSGEAMCLLYYFFNRTRKPRSDRDEALLDEERVMPGVTSPNLDKVKIPWDAMGMPTS